MRRMSKKISTGVMFACGKTVSWRSGAGSISIRDARL
jgi:hypothetical protein